jgi:hypothetical protein
MSEPYFARFMRPKEYAAYRAISIHTLRYWMRVRLVPHLKVGRMIMLDVAKADAALSRFEIQAAAK